MAKSNISSVRKRGRTRVPKRNHDKPKNTQAKWAFTSPVDHPAAAAEKNNSDDRQQNVTEPSKSDKLVLRFPPPLVPYNIVEIEKKVPEPVSLGSVLSDLVNPLTVINTVTYLGLLLGQLFRGNEKSYATALLFFIGQLYEHSGIITESVWHTVVNLVRDRTPKPKLRIIGGNVPSVDVFVVCCGEPEDVILDTVKAACKIDWPVDKFRVIVADDGKSDSLEKGVEQLQETHTNLHYHARVKPVGKHHGYKAGNLNGTLDNFVAKLPAGHSEYIAVFDADMMPEPQILRALIPHAIRDPDVGMVTAAQHHYNIPNNDPLYQFNMTGPSDEDGVRDSANTAWCPGSGFVLRTVAWKEIGKFPEFSITEDLITSWFLHGHEWKIVLVHEVLQWGLQPDCLLTHLKQRRRWWTGHIRDAIRMRFTLGEPHLDGASMIQRYAMIQHSCRPYTMTINHAINTMLVLVCLWLGGPVVATSDATAIFQVVTCLGLLRMLASIDDIKAVLSHNYLNVRRRAATGIWMGHHFSRDTFQTLLPKGLGGLRLSFGVSGVEDKRQIAVKERDITKRPPLLTRLWAIHQREGLLWHLVLFLVTLTLVVSRVQIHINAATVDGKLVLDNTFWLNLIKSVGFPGLALIDTAPFYLTPLFYVISPPVMPERRDSMEYDVKTGLWKPLPQYRKIKWTVAS